MTIEARTWAQAVRRPSVALTIVAVVAALLWWQFPVLAGHGDRTDVLIVADDFLAAHERPVTYRIHEDGQSLQWAPAVADWCAVPAVLTDAVARVRPTTVVLSFGRGGGCADALQRAVAAAGDRTVIIVRQPGASGVERPVAGATLVDPSPLIGETESATSMPCLWWEACEKVRTMQVRSADGALTAAGTDRVARLLVAELP